MPEQRRFAYDHLPEHLQEVSRPYYDMAVEAIGRHPDDPLLVPLLDALFEAKNLAVLMTARPYRSPG